MAHTPGRNARPAPPVLSGTPVAQETLNTHPDYRLGWRLLQAGYPWEAHEAWEAVWRPLPESSPGRVLLRALIRLAAAGVKARQRSRAGLTHHLEGARRHLLSLGGTPVAGISPEELAAWVAGIDHETWLQAGPDAPGPLVGFGPV